MSVQPIEANKPESGFRGTEGQDKVVAKSTGRRWIWVAAALGLLVFASWLVNAAGVWLRADTTVRADRLRIAAVSRGDLVRDIPIQGAVVAAIKPTVFAPSSGRVSILVSAGQAVGEGDIVALVTSPQLDSERKQAESLLASQKTSAERESILGRQTDLQNRQAVDLARVEVTAAERELRRAEKSWEYQVISRQDLEEAVDNLERARLEFNHRKEDARLFRERQAFEERTRALDVEQQALRVDELARQVDALSVRSPVSGIVGNLNIEDQAAVAADAGLMSVVDLSQLELEVALSQSYADEVQVGMPATIRYSGNDYEAVVSSISPEVSQNTVATRLRFAKEQPAGLRQNQRLTGRIELDGVDDALLLPRGAFFDSEGGRAVYVIEGEFAVRRSIVAGATSTASIQILEGLETGEKVIVSATDSFEGAAEVLIVD